MAGCWRSAPIPNSARHSTGQVARHERACGPPQAGGMRVEWYRYGVPSKVGACPSWESPAEPFEQLSFGQTLLAREQPALSCPQEQSLG